MSWDNTSNIVSGDTTMQQYIDYLNGGQLNTQADQEYLGSLNSQAQGVLDDYNRLLAENGNNEKLAKQAFKDKYGMSIDAAMDAWKGQALQYTTNRKQSEMAKAEAYNQQRQARESTIANREAAAKQAQTQARSQGLSKGLASSIGNAPLSGQASANYGNNLGALRNLSQSTKNDFLQKMGYANALEQQAENMSKGSGLNVIGAAVGGAGTGAGIGASLFGGLGKGD